MISQYTHQLGMSDLMTRKIRAGRRSSTVMASAASVEEEHGKQNIFKLLLLSTSTQ